MKEQEKMPEITEEEVEDMEIDQDVDGKDAMVDEDLLIGAAVVCMCASAFVCETKEEKQRRKRMLQYIKYKSKTLERDPSSKMSISDEEFLSQRDYFSVTGLEKEEFDSLFEYVKLQMPTSCKSHKLGNKSKFFVTLNYIRHYPAFPDMEDHFKLSRSSLSGIVSETLKTMCLFFNFLNLKRKEHFEMSYILLLHHLPFYFRQKEFLQFEMILRSQESLKTATDTSVPLCFVI